MKTRTFAAALLVAAFATAPTLPSAAKSQGAQTPAHDHGPAAQDAASTATHKTTGVVKRIDAANGKVTLEHEAVKTLNWPRMTMAFTVQDKALLSRLAQDRKVEFEFQQRGTNYVITAVR